MRPEERAALPGVAASRSRQLLAGAVIAAATMEALDITHVDVCPWALREGLLLRRITELSKPSPRARDGGPCTPAGFETVVIQPAGFGPAGVASLDGSAVWAGRRRSGAEMAGRGAAG